jgi:hypothetical protein
MNSAGLTMATLIVILRTPSKISVEVIVEPKPISILNASSGVDPTSIPEAH